MITKGLRNKIAAGVIAATLVGGTGTVFADTNAGAQLQTWYNAQFNAAKVSVTASVAKYTIPVVVAFTSWTKDTKNTAVAEVSKAGTDEEARAKGAINAALQEHKDALAAAQSSIESGMPGQFDTFIANSNKTVDTFANAAQTAAQADINYAVNKQGKTSLDSVTTNVGAAETAAVTDLTNTIQSAKDSINGKIEAEKTAATTEITNHINDQIKAKKQEITTATNKLVGEKEKAITDEGQRIENEAKDTLNVLVDNITK